ncbi:MAG TPA: polysaccharide biosynthesis protein [Patescibacteria group bacterium]|nr:polysaccharide biosynthesis protein [Patescibacteria group bacterium]
MTLDRKGWALVGMDVVAVCAAALGANYLRFDEVYPADFIHFEQWLLLDLMITPFVFYMMGLYRSAWRYASISDLKVILYAVGARTLLLMSLFIFLGYDRGVPRSTTVLETILLLCAVGGIRLLTRVHREMRQVKNLRNKTPVLIVGAGDAGEIILRELRGNDSLPYNPVGFIDDDPAKWGVRIHGVPVLGSTFDIPQVARRRRISEVIIAIPSASGRQLTAIYRACKTAGVRTKTVPPVSQLFEGRLSLSQIRNVELEDLLGRDAVNVEMGVISSSLSGKRVLITGGAGSIGRELARQVAEIGPERLVVLDRNENSIYFTEMDLRKRFPSVAIDCVIGDILDKTRLSEVMESCRPQIVFHAAAFSTFR